MLICAAINAHINQEEKKSLEGLNTGNRMDVDKEIYEFMKNILNKYSEIRGTTDLKPNEFWDLVVISACDENQMKGYELQVKEKQVRKEIPQNIPFHIFADPPGYKIGCGGSTMFVLDKLFQIYGNAFLDMRILFIPAGGHSQRLPNLTVLGKLFSPLPFGATNYQMLDLILATYLPFLNNMQPGIFLASSDAIISYSLNENDNWTFNNEGITALAHPSPISVGCGHGVYVLPPIEDQSSNTAFMSDCLRVLQKPSIEDMYEKGAVTNFKSGDDDHEIIFSDSAFFFDHHISSKLMKFYNSNKPLKCELNSYGDFLQPLGINASPSYILTKETNEELALQRSSLYRNLYGTSLSVLVLKSSFFHHFGTMKEYLGSFCFKSKFSDVFPMCKINFSSWSVNSIIPLYIEGTVMHSILHPMSNVCESTLIEYCDINIAVDFGKNCIISNIQLQGFPVQRFPYRIPDDTLLHTAVVENGFVTIACNINDNIKKTCENRLSFEMDFFGKTLKAWLAPDVGCFTQNSDSFSLWNAKIFPVKETPEESLVATMKIISCETDDEMKYIYYNLDEQCIKLISMEDILFLKNTEKMIDYQQKLYSKIKKCINND